MNRWISERKAALLTAVSYWKAKKGGEILIKSIFFKIHIQFIVFFSDSDEDIKGFVVWAGLEPLEFKALFPDWADRNDIKEINVQVSNGAIEYQNFLVTPNQIN